MKYFPIILSIITFIDLIRSTFGQDPTPIEINLNQDNSGTLKITQGGGWNNYYFYKLKISDEIKAAKDKDLMIQVKPVQTYKSISDPDIYISKVNKL